MANDTRKGIFTDLPGIDSSKVIPSDPEIRKEGSLKPEHGYFEKKRKEDDSQKSYKGWDLKK